MSVNIVIFSDAETPADEKLPLEVLSKFNGKTREVTMLFTDSISHHESTLPGPDQAAGDPEDDYRDPGQEDH